MDRIELGAESRVVKKGDAKRLRASGMVPAMVYGRGVDNAPVKIATMELSRTLAEAGASQLIHLRIDASEATRPVLAREIQRDVLNGEPLHVDFLAVNMAERITAEVSISLFGEPQPIDTETVLVFQGATSIEIECLPGDLIPVLEVDVSELTLDSAIYVGDLRVPAGITILSDPEEMVAQIIRERLMEEEEEEEELIFEEPIDVEVIARGRAEEDVDDA